MNRKLVTSAAVLTAVLGGAGAATAAASGSHNAQEPTRARSTVARATAASCDGGAQKSVKTRIVSSPFTYAESSGTVAVPGARVVVSGPARGTDVLNIDFSAEARLSGSTGTQDWQGLEVRVDGSPIQPYTASGDVLAINGADTWGLHAGGFCTRVGPGQHVVQVLTNLADFDTDDSLSGWLDDYTLKVVRSQ